MRTLVLLYIVLALILVTLASCGDNPIQAETQTDKVQTIKISTQNTTKIYEYNKLIFKDDMLYVMQSDSIGKVYDMKSVINYETFK